MVNFFVFLGCCLWLCTEGSVRLNLKQRQDDFIGTIQSKKNNSLPIVIWHGMGDNCCGGIWEMKRELSQELGVYTYSIMIGDSPEEDTENGFYMTANDQVKQACQKIASNPKLKGGFNAIGFSQGSQFLRAYVERCNTPKVHNLISLGGQHQGVSKLPNCHSGYLCTFMAKLIGIGAYFSFVQNHLAQANYWHAADNEKGYLKYCQFLPDINNAQQEKNSLYKKNLMSLNKFVMVKFLYDTMVAPAESQHFEFFDPNNSSKILPLEESQIYKEDWIGLKAMNENKQLVFLTVKGDHLQFSMEWMRENLYPYLEN